MAKPLTEAQQEAFLQAFAETGVVTVAASAAGIDRKRHYDWLEDVQKYPDYEARFRDAVERACDRLEAEMVRRAVDGWEEPVYQQGTRVGEIRRFSDRLLEVALKARRPERFRERQSIEHTGKDGGPIEARGVSVAELVARGLLSEEQMREIVAAQQKLLAGKE